MINLLMSVVLLSSLFVSYLTAPYSYATGSFAGNGADDINGEWYSAWFLGKKQISWCIEISDSFGVDRLTAKTTIERAIRHWHTYLIGKRGLFQTEDSGAEWIYLNTRYVDKCSSDTHLTFYLGVMNDIVKEGHKFYRNPIAFSRATEYDEQLSFGKGYVWIKDGRQNDGMTNVSTPDWSLDANLKGILLHEIGHILGCRHIEGTIMTKNIARILLTPRYPDRLDTNIDPLIPNRDWARRRFTVDEKFQYNHIRKIFLSNIDYSKELWYSNKTGIILHQFAYFKESQSSSDIADEYVSQLKYSFNKVMGHTPKGDGLYSRFIQYIGLTDTGHSIAMLELMDNETFQELKVGRIDKSDPRVQTFYIKLDPINSQSNTPLGENIVFRRFYNSLTYPKYSMRTTRNGSIVAKMIGRRPWIRFQKKDQERVIYTRNVGRYTSSSNWDPTIAKLELINRYHTKKILFRGAFDQQFGMRDSLMYKPGGVTKPAFIPAL